MAKLERLIRRYSSIAATIDILRRKELPLLDPQNWDDRNDRYFMNLYREKKDLGGLYGLCAATCSETIIFGVSSRMQPMAPYRNPPPGT